MIEIVIVLFIRSLECLFSLGVGALRDHLFLKCSVKMYMG